MPSIFAQPRPLCSRLFQHTRQNGTSVRMRMRMPGGCYASNDVKLLGMREAYENRYAKDGKMIFLIMKEA